MLGLPLWDGTATSLLQVPATPTHPSQAQYSAREASFGQSHSSGPFSTPYVSSSSVTSTSSSLIDWEKVAAVIVVTVLAFLLYYGILEFLEEKSTPVSKSYMDKSTSTEPEQQKSVLDAVTDSQSDPKSYIDKSTSPEPEERATFVDAGTSTDPDSRDEVVQALDDHKNKQSAEISHLKRVVRTREEKAESLLRELREERDVIRSLEQEVSTKSDDRRSLLGGLRQRVEQIVLDSDGWKEYNNSFPNGHETIATSSQGLWCGLYAVISTLEAMHSWIIPPSIEDLLAAFISLDVQEKADGSEMRNVNNFSVDQVASALFSWGRSRGLELQLGYLVEGKAPRLIGVDTEGKTTIVWIYNNGMNLLTGDQSMGHFSGMRPNGVRDDPSEAILRLVEHQLSCRQREVSHLGHMIVDQSVEIARLRRQAASQDPKNLAILEDMGFSASQARERLKKAKGDVSKAALLVTGDAEDLSDLAKDHADGTSNTTDEESNAVASNTAGSHCIPPTSSGEPKGDGNGLEGKPNGQAMDKCSPSIPPNDKAPNTTQGKHLLPPKPPTPSWLLPTKVDMATNATPHGRNKDDVPATPIETPGQQGNLYPRPTRIPGPFQQAAATHPLPSRIPNPTNALPRTTNGPAKPIFDGSKPVHGLPARPPTAADTMFECGGFKVPTAASGAKIGRPASTSTSPPSPPTKPETKADEPCKSTPTDSAKDHQADGDEAEEGKEKLGAVPAARPKQDDAEVRTEDKEGTAVEGHKGTTEQEKPESFDSKIKHDANASEGDHVEGMSEGAEKDEKHGDATEGGDADIKGMPKNDGEGMKREDAADTANETALLGGEKQKKKRRRKKRTGRGKDMTPEEWDARVGEEERADV